MNKSKPFLFSFLNSQIIKLHKGFQYVLIVLLFTSFTIEDKTLMNSENKKTTIEMWSDIVCPFCLLGKKKLEKAIKRNDAQDKVNIVFRSFQLDAEFPLNYSAPTKENLVKRKGYPAVQVEQMCNHLTTEGKSYGINFDFDKALTVNTKNAHRLIHWAKEHNKAAELKEALMTAHFSSGKDLSSFEELKSVAVSVGLDSLAASQVLNSNRYEENLMEDKALANKIGIRGVPFFVINGKETISGAQSDEVFNQAILSILKK